MAILTSMLFVSCEPGTDPIDGPADVIMPSSYKYVRGGNSTVSYEGQIIRLDMHTLLKETIGSSKDTSLKLSSLQGMFEHQAGKEDFSDGPANSASVLNASGKQIANKSGVSVSYHADVKSQFIAWFTSVADNSNPSKMAVKGTSGYLDRKADGSKKILVDKNGFEYSQVISKSLMGALELDQIVNVYLSDSKLNVENKKNEDGKGFTKMEHHWDEAFGYSALHKNALNLTGDQLKKLEKVKVYRRFWGGYIYAVDSGVAGSGIKNEIIKAYLTGRQAIHVKNYDVRDKQATIIKKALSKVCAIRAVHYLVAGKSNVLSTNAQEKAGAFHELSEAYGFIYGLQFTNNGTGKSYFSKSEVDGMLNKFKANGGLYNADIESVIDNLADKISAKFGFDKAKA